MIFLWLLIVPAIITFITELIQIQNIQDTIEWALQNTANFIIGYIVVVLIFLIIYFLFNKLSLATVIGGGIFIAFALINHYKILMRGDPLMPWDLILNKEASNIMGYIDISFNNIIVGTIALYIVLIVTSIFIKPKKIKFKFRFPFAILSITILMGFMNGVYFNSESIQKLKINDVFWNQTRNYEINGFLVGFGMNIKNIIIKPPIGYSKNEIEKIVKDYYNIDENNNIKDNTPNIIMIMNEAYWDPTQLQGVEYKTNPIPTLSRLRDTSATGWLLSPEYGGGTANTEFEVLTGHSVSFLPSGSMAYQQYVNGNLDSLASYLKDKGYKTTAIHPYQKWFWDRENVYPNLGFDDFISDEDFENPMKKGQFISDMEASYEIIRQYEKNKGKPFFNYTVTMQNHGPYNDKRYGDNIIKVEGDNLSEESIDILETYTAGVRDADEALEYLIDYFSKVDEPTIIVMFGDHLPMLGNDYSVYRQAGYISSSDLTLEDNKKLHLTPLIIWNNYDNNKKDIGIMNPYYLGGYIMEEASMDMPMYFQILNNIKKQIPAYIRGLAIDEDENLSETLEKTEEKIRQKHWMIQYDLMFGSEYFKQFEKLY